MVPNPVCTRLKLGLFFTIVIAVFLQPSDYFNANANKLLHNINDKTSIKVISGRSSLELHHSIFSVLYVDVVKSDEGNRLGCIVG